MPDYRAEQKKRIAEMNKKAKKKSAFKVADEQAARASAREARAAREQRAKDAGTTVRSDKGIRTPGSFRPTVTYTRKDYIEDET